MSALSELREKVERASGGSRELDGDLFQLLGGQDWRRAYIKVQEPSGCPHDQAVEYARDRFSPHYTASIAPPP
jgi:hypothetical protein